MHCRWSSVRRSHKSWLLGIPTIVGFSLTITGCEGQATPAAETDDIGLSPSARPELLATLREDLAAERGPRDGGGRAWLEEEVTATVGTRGRFPLVYEVGPAGIADGGYVFLQVSPFWGWSTPQTVDRNAPGFTEVTTEAEDVELQPTTLGEQLLGIQISGREMIEGEHIRLVFGAGSAGASVDRFAERRSPFWFSVDGDGDGIRGLVPNPPTVSVLAGRPAQLRLLVPATARPRETIDLVVAVLDPYGNAGVDVAGKLSVDWPPGLEGPRGLTLEPAQKGLLRVPLEVKAEGVYRLDALFESLGGDAFEATSNPLVVSTDGPRLLWADLHGHSGLSDGTGTPEDYFHYARDVAALQVIALTDHDHWGMEPLSTHQALWDEIRQQTEAFNDSGRFVTILAYEWTNWLHGHRHVLYFKDSGEVLSSVDPRYETPFQLWDALRGQPALTFAHHSAGGPIATNWNIPPDPELEPVTEIVSVHGSSEAFDSPAGIYSAVQGNFVRDALGRGYQLGFIGSGDSHDGHPGLAQLASPVGGLAAIWSETLTREAVREALQARRVYATDGTRIYLDVRFRGEPMGSSIEPGSGELTVRALAPWPIATVELIRSGQVQVVAEPEEDEAQLELPIDGLESGEYLYIRVLLEERGAGWSSPFYVR